MMREACFYTVFCGIETPELGALDAMHKSHNRVMPLLDAVATINSYGIEVVSGIILGLDTDTAATGASLIEFIDRSHIPVLTINLLQALPKTPLWERLAASGRLNFDPTRESNVVFTRPYGEVLATWRAAIHHAYSPEAIFGRFEWNLRAHLSEPDHAAAYPRPAQLAEICGVARYCSPRLPSASAFAVTIDASSGDLPRRRCAPGASRS